MRTDPDLEVNKRRSENFVTFKKWLAIVVCFITAYFFFIKILFL
jgi:hypothetical protein